MKTRRKYLQGILAALWVIAASGCGSNNAASNNSAKSAEAQSLTIGYNPTIGQPQALVGVVGGEYQKALPDVKIDGQMFDAAPAVMEQLRAGTIQIGCGGPFPALRAFVGDGDVVLLCNAANGGTQLMVKKDSPIKSVADLKGTVIGVNQLGSTVEALVRYQLVQAKLNPNNDVKFAQIKPAEQAAALKNDDVQAVAAPAPWPSQVLADADARALLDSKAIYDDGNYSSAAFFTTKKFAEANPQLIQKFIKATEKITADLNADRVAADKKVLQNWEKATTKTLKPEVAKDAFATIVYDTKLDQSALQKFADINFQLGVLRQKPDLNGFIWKSAP